MKNRHTRSMVWVFTCGEMILQRSGQVDLSAPRTEVWFKVRHRPPSSQMLMQSLLHARAWETKRRRANPFVNFATLARYVLLTILIFMMYTTHTGTCPDYCRFVGEFFSFFWSITPPQNPVHPCFRDPCSSFILCFFNAITIDKLTVKETSYC